MPLENVRECGGSLMKSAVRPMRRPLGCKPIAGSSFLISLCDCDDKCTKITMYRQHALSYYN